MATCSLCGREVVLPFRCSYCGRSFCEFHRLPEGHDCEGLDVLRRPKTEWRERRREQRPISLPRAYSEPGVRGVASTLGRQSELRDLAIAWISISFCYSVRFLHDITIFLEYFLISLVTIGSGFLLHELAHRSIARRYGLWAQFKLWWSGLIIALATAVLTGGTFFFAAPGAVHILPSRKRPLGPSRRESGMISLSGAVANVAVGVFFRALTPLGGVLANVGSIGYRINLLLAVFNLLPVPPLDGQKVMSWSVVIWAAAFVPLAGLLFFDVLL